LTAKKRERYKKSNYNFQKEGYFKLLASNLVIRFKPYTILVEKITL